VVGVELSEEAVTEATRLAHEARLETRSSFLQADASEPLSFEDGTFDALICIDAINHLSRRADVLRDWTRVLRSGGRLLFTDPVVITGILDGEELAIRTSIGYVLFVPPGENERLLAAAGLTVVDIEDTTGHLAEIARRRHDARAAQAETLTEIEGHAAFAGRQRFFDLVAMLAHDRRLSRLVYTAEKQTQAHRSPLSLRRLRVVHQPVRRPDGVRHTGTTGELADPVKGVGDTGGLLG
jgi:SAM-dependent methyltransferase